MKVKVRCIKHYEKYDDNRYYSNEYIAFYKDEIYDLKIGNYVFDDVRNSIFDYTVTFLGEDAYFIDEEQMNEYFIIDIKETRKQKLNIINENSKSR
jgi:hypothetical protein